MRLFPTLWETAGLTRCLWRFRDFGDHASKCPRLVQNPPFSGNGVSRDLFGCWTEGLRAPESAAWRRPLVSRSIRPLGSARFSRPLLSEEIRDAV